MATIKDIANRLGVSVSTVSKGLNGASDISEELRQIVLDTAVEMGYSTKRSKKEENRKRDENLQASEQLDVIQNEFMEEIDAHAGADGQHGKHIHERRKIDIGNTAAARAFILALTLQSPRANKVDMLFAIRTGRNAEILHK